jgi:ribonuclease HII
MTSQRLPSSIEAELLARGFNRLVGLDEAGRGPCAGPLVAAAVAFNGESDLNWAKQIGICDSKSLSANKRKKLALEIKARCPHQIIEVSSAEIDANGLQPANISAMRRAASAIIAAGDFLLVDGFALDGLGEATLSMWKGDQVSLAIGAASILAKEYRDELMICAAEIYPGYGFERHMGYSTAAHMKAIAQYGLTPIHRKSYKNLAAYL